MWLGIRTFWHGLRDLLLPPSCLLCSVRLPADRDGSPRSHFCSPCADALLGDTRGNCPRCAATIGPHALTAGGCPRCRGESFAFAGACTLGEYDGPLRDAVLRLKHRGSEGLAELLGELWGDHARGPLLALEAGAIVPVPLHWWRRLRRGYNQCDALARGLARSLNLPVIHGCLRRCRNTAAQTSIPYSARKDNVRGAFRAIPSPAISSKTLLLVDDVMTTGSTLHEAARALRQAGATRILVATLARAGAS